MSCSTIQNDAFKDMDQTHKRAKISFFYGEQFGDWDTVRI